MWVIGSLVFLIPAVVITVAAALPVIEIRDNFSCTHPALTALRPAREVALSDVRSAARAHDRRVSALPLWPPVAAGDHPAARPGHHLRTVCSATPCAPMNLAGVVPWNFARALAMLALLFAGNLFCMACPFTLPRELGKRLGLRDSQLAARAARQMAERRRCWLSSSGATKRFAIWDHPSPHRLAAARLFRRTRSWSTPSFAAPASANTSAPSANSISSARWSRRLRVEVRSQIRLRVLPDARLHRRQPAAARLRA